MSKSNSTKMWHCTGNHRLIARLDVGTWHVAKSEWVTETVLQSMNWRESRTRSTPKTPHPSFPLLLSFLTLFSRITPTWQTTPHPEICHRLCKSMESRRRRGSHSLDKSIIAAILVLLIHGSYSFYLPGVAPQDFKKVTSLSLSLALSLLVISVVPMLCKCSPLYISVCTCLICFYPLLLGYAFKFDLPLISKFNMNRVCLGEKVKDYFSLLCWSKIRRLHFSSSLLEIDDIVKCLDWMLIFRVLCNQSYIFSLC